MIHIDGEQPGKGHPADGRHNGRGHHIAQAHGFGGEKGENHGEQQGEQHQGQEISLMDQPGHGFQNPDVPLVGQVQKGLTEDVEGQGDKQGDD